MPFLNTVLSSLKEPLLEGTIYLAKQCGTELSHQAANNLLVCGAITGVVGGVAFNATTAVAGAGYSCLESGVQSTGALTGYYPNSGGYASQASTGGSLSTMPIQQQTIGSSYHAKLFEFMAEKPKESFESLPQTKSFANAWLEAHGAKYEALDSSLKQETSTTETSSDDPSNDDVVAKKKAYTTI